MNEERETEREREREREGPGVSVAELSSNLRDNPGYSVTSEESIRPAFTGRIDGTELAIVVATYIARPQTRLSLPRTFRRPFTW